MLLLYLKWGSQNYNLGYNTRSIKISMFKTSLVFMSKLSKDIFHQGFSFFKHSLHKEILYHTSTNIPFQKYKLKKKLSRKQFLYHELKIFSELSILEILVYMKFS